MKHASLFSGLGGFDLAAQWMGWENVFSCEYMPFPQSILKHHFPTTTHYGDIRELDGTKYRGTIDVLTGGFPCQPFSAAGKRKGTEDNRFLWPEMLRVIREIQPTWIVAENVRGIVSIDNGLVFERVCSEMEANGYEVQPFCIPACAVGAPHRRERMWFIARSNASSERWDDRGDNREGRHIQTDEGTTEENQQERQGRKCGIGEIGTNDSDSNNTRLEGCEKTRNTCSCGKECDKQPRGHARCATTDPDCKRFQGRGKFSEFQTKKSAGCIDCASTDSRCELWGQRSVEGMETDTKIRTASSIPCERGDQSNWSEDWREVAFATCYDGVDDGLSERLHGITLPKWRKESLKAYGNAIVPQIAYKIFQSISLAQDEPFL